METHLSPPSGTERTVANQIPADLKTLVHDTIPQMLSEVGYFKVAELFQEADPDNLEALETLLNSVGVRLATARARLQMLALKTADTQLRRQFQAKQKQVEKSAKSLADAMRIVFLISGAD